MSKPMNHCEQFKELLVEQSQSAIKLHPELAAHLPGCAACQRLLQAWNEIPGLLEQLPEFEPEEAVLEKVSAAVGGDTTGHAPRQRRRLLAPSLASAAVLLAAIGLSRELLLHEAPRAPVPMSAPVVTPRAAGQLRIEGDRDSGIIDQRFNDEFGRGGDQLADNAPLLERIKGAQQVTELRSDDVSTSSAGAKAKQTRKRRVVKPQSPAVVIEPYDRESELARRQSSKPAEAFFKDADGTPVDAPDKNENMVTTDEIAELAQKAAEDKKSPADEPETALKESFQFQVAATKAPHGAVSGGEIAGFGGRSITGLESRIATGFDFLAHYQQTTGLQFQPPSGYWANTYIPGDPQIRLLSARLAQWDRSWLQHNARLEQDVAPLQQPFDAPVDSALALSLMADVAAVPLVDNTTGDGTGDPLSSMPTRMRVQVGIQGIEHRNGQRPAMNVAMVVDLPADAPDEVRIATRALLDALLQSKQAGDHFSLVLTGQENGFPGLVVEADDFRFGTLQLARQVILGQNDAAGAASAHEPGSLSEHGFIDAYTALQRAGSMVQASDDPSRPLGSSEVLLISARELPDVERLATLAHERASEGITLSVFPLGQQAQNHQAQQLVASGLGNRRYLEAPAGARTLIEEELYTASRAVARAARLSIRLAPGVQLIGVVGSESLDAARAQRVRDIETSMDRRLSANLGIQADRGEDDEGIQIVIPSIYSGDSVTVLLDVVTDRPGAIVDVTLRYKDLVFLRNGSLSGHLELPQADTYSDQPERGPAELVVLKNLLAWHFTQAVEQAAEALGQGQAAKAAAILRAMHDTIEHARRHLPAWANDPDLIHDQQVLERYITALDSPQAATDQALLTDSLRLAAWAKTHTLPQEWK